MNDITYAKEIMNSLLMEAELKDSFSEFKEDSIIRLTLEDGSEETFVVREVLAGRVKMVHKGSKILFTFTKDAIKDGVMTIYKFDGKQPNNEGEPENFKLKEFMVGKEGGDIETIDIVDNEAEQRVVEINQELKTAKEGDILYISSEEHNTKGDIVNTILLKVVNVEESMMSCVLEGVESENEKGDTSSYAMDTLVKTFKQHTLYIKSDNLVKIVDGKLVLILTLGSVNRPVPISNILNIEVHPNADSDIDKEDSDELARQEFLQQYGHSEEFLQAIEKTPSFWDTFLGASPKGRSQIEKIINRSLTDNAYLTKGNSITFKLLSKTAFISREFTLRKDKKIYVGTMEKNNVLKLGTRKRGHWELKIVKELSPSIYNVKIKFCDKGLNCESFDNGTIKVIRNG